MRWGKREAGVLGGCYSSSGKIGWCDKQWQELDELEMYLKTDLIRCGNQRLSVCVPACSAVADSLQGWEKVSNVFWWVFIMSNWGNLGKGGLGMWGWGVENRKKKNLSVGPMKLEILVRSQREIFWTGGLKGGLSERHKSVDQPCIQTASKPRMWMRLQSQREHTGMRCPKGESWEAVTNAGSQT